MIDMKKTVLEFNATITTMGAMRGVTFPKAYAETIEPLLNIKKHKFTVIIEELPPE